MMRRCPFALKLGLSFGIVILLSVALVYFLTARAITSRFAAYRAQEKQRIAQQVSSLLAEYRTRTGTWLGAERLLLAQYTVRINNQVVARHTPLVGGRFSLADERGLIIVSTEEALVGTTLSSAAIAEGISIAVDGKLLGTLCINGKEVLLGPEEEEFLSSAQRSAMLGGAIASGVAFLLAVFLIVQVLSPLRLLSRATERIAQGDLSQRVRLTARDEFGRLGESFNRMIDNLQRSETIRRTMTADIAHELRTPVTIIQANLEAILDEIYTLDAETITPIYEETLHLGRLIDDLRDLALAEAGELQLDKEPTDLVQLASHVVETINFALEHGPKLTVISPPALPSLSLDPKRIRQVLANLLGNALRYTPDDGEIRVEIARVEDAIELRVVDNGPGIASEDLPHLFERFYRGDRARSRAAGGSGLGLAIAKHWVEAHGGRIFAQNVETGGARFTVLLYFA
ncbi:ATP-binding protein [Candidatus Bipolaricaulota bacterium]|nr:ATP-binding protein [Candidatus Bipolaricaulota bacterium]